MNAFETLIDFTTCNIIEKQVAKAKEYWISANAEKQVRTAIRDANHKATLIEDVIFVNKVGSSFAGGVAFAGKKYKVSANSATGLYIKLGNLLDSL